MWTLVIGMTDPIEPLEVYEFETDAGTRVTVHRSGGIQAVNQSQNINIERRLYTIETHNGQEVLYAGIRETPDGSEKIYVPVDGHMDKIRQVDMPKEAIEVINEAIESGEEVRLSRSYVTTKDPDVESDLDHVETVATPDGEVVTRRTHCG